MLKWTVRSKETANFTYDLEEDNKRYLASMIADVLNLQFTQVMSFFKEIEEDVEFTKHIADGTEKSDWGFIADKEVRLEGESVGTQLQERLNQK